MSKFNERFRELRIEKNYTRKKVADDLNVLIRTISYWECGKTECNFDTLIKIAEYFNVTLDYLLGKKDF
jgi:transcriptional regulator with XRE-family HTH domain